MEGIVIGVDESDGAAAALRWGVDHGDLHRRPCTAVLAWTFRDQHQLDASFDLNYGRREASRDLDAILARALVVPHPTLSRRVVTGRPADELIAASHDADLVVVGARGMGGFKGLLLGSVSREVLHGASCPVAVVRAPGEPDGPIVIGVDGSTTSRGALRWAIEEARVRGCRLIALATWHVSAIDENPRLAHADAQSMAESADRLLEREVAQCARPDVAIERRVMMGFPAGALVDESRTASMVVMGSRGHRTATGLLLGSVSDQVTHHADCPVVVVPPGAVAPRAVAGAAVGRGVTR